MRDTVYHFVFDGFADYQTTLALTEVRRPGCFAVRTVGLSCAPVESMSGLTVRPDVDLAGLDASRAAMVLAPGGSLWERGDDAAFVVALRQAHGGGAPVAGICGATLGLGRAGLLDARRHTSNHPRYIDRFVPGYDPAQYDAGVLAVTDEGVSTAGSVGIVEFAREVIRTLDLYDDTDVAHWYRWFRHGTPLPWFSAGRPVPVAA